jgi:hypothetical protein
LRERYSRFDRIELWSLDQNLNLSIWSPNTNGRPNLYGLANVVDTSSPKSSSLDSNGIQRRATEWREKISALFNQVTIWVRTKGYLVNHAATIPMNEELMQLFGVAPIGLPILKILESKVLVAAIVPIGLWTIGGYGRPDLITPKTAVMIINTNPDPNLTTWFIYNSINEVGQPLDEDTLLRLLSAQ